MQFVYATLGLRQVYEYIDKSAEGYQKTFNNIKEKQDGIHREHSVLIQEQREAYREDQRLQKERDLRMERAVLALEQLVRQGE